MVETVDLEHFAQRVVDDLHAQENYKNRKKYRLKNSLADIEEIPQGENWSLTEDGTLDFDGSTQQWPIELVSPILPYNKNGDWREEIQEILGDISKTCTIEVNESCGLHVHVSPPEGTPWDLCHLKSICRSILHFEGAINAILPAYRRHHSYAASNTCGNRQLREKDAEERLRAVNQCEGTIAIINLMNDGGRRYFGWNFCNLEEGGKKTVEFRQSPAVCEASACIAWVLSCSLSAPQKAVQAMSSSYDTPKMSAGF